ncbi:MAG: hypothetical protein IT385_00805 [Deltaproteobacteria bacterium]|nr:hypothetical protein [Deltaproteobacteria bacterium]
MPRFIRYAVLLVALGIAPALVGCKAIERMLPAKTIDNPTEGSPEWVIFKAIEAALVADTNEGYKIVRPLLHSEVKDSPAAESHYRQNVFEAFHRKAYLFSIDDKTGAYKLDYDDDSEKPGEIIKIFVVNEKSDMPTPCRLKRDPKQNNDWKISSMCSL